jgi:hypothetical protein
MMSVDATTALALAAALVLLLSFLAGRRRRTPVPRHSKKDAPDGALAHTPVPARVLTVAERQAHTLLRQAMPGYLVLAQVPSAVFSASRRIRQSGCSPSAASVRTCCSATAVRACWQ